MENNDKQMEEESIINWINSLKFVTQKLSHFEDLKSGVAILEIIEYMDTNNVYLKGEQIIKEPGDDWSLQLQNLTTIKDSLQRYYDQDCNKLQENNNNNNENQQQKIYLSIEPISILNDLTTDSVFELMETFVGAIILKYSSKQQEMIDSMVNNLDSKYQNYFTQFVQKVTDKYEKLSGIQEHNSPTEKVSRNSSHVSIENSNIQQLSGNEQRIIGELNEKTLNQGEEIQKYVDKIDYLMAENSQLQQQNQDFKENTEQLNNQLIISKQIQEEKEKQFEDLKKEHRESLQNLGLEDLDEVQSEIASKTTRIKELQKFLDQERLEHQEKLREQQEEIRELQKKTSQISQFKKLQELYQEKCDENQQLKNDAELIEQGLTQAQKEMFEKNKKIENQEQKIKNFRGKLDREKSDGVGLQVELEKKLCQIDTLKQSVDSLTAEKAEFMQSMYRLNEQLDLLRNEVKKQDQSSMLSLSPDIEHRNNILLYNQQQPYLRPNTLSEEMSKKINVTEFKEYLGVFTDRLDSAENNNEGLIKSQGSREETLKTEEEEEKKGNNSQRKHKNSGGENNNNRRGSQNNNVNMEEFEDLKHNNQVLKDKLKELVIEIEALKTTISAQDGHSVKGTSDERQGLISSNEALSDLLKKKSLIIDQLSFQNAQFDQHIKNLTGGQIELLKLRKQTNLFKKQVEIIKTEHNEQNRQKEEEIKVMVSVLHSLQQQIKQVQINQNQ